VSESWSLTLREEHRIRVFGEQDDENIWTYEVGSETKMEKTA
jgi:hypothetical protein